jgi:hypothetical protein
MHHSLFGQAHPLFPLLERERATSSRACPDGSGLTPTKSARSPDRVGAEVHPSHLWVCQYSSISFFFATIFGVAGVGDPGQYGRCNAATGLTEPGYIGKPNILWLRPCAAL